MFYLSKYLLLGDLSQNIYSKVIHKGNRIDILKKNLVPVTDNNVEMDTNLIIIFTLKIRLGIMSNFKIKFYINPRNFVNKCLSPYSC